MVNLDKIDHLSNKGETLGHGKQIVTPMMILSTETEGKTRGGKVTTGVNFPQIKKIVVEREKENILNQNTGAGYATKQSVINLLFNKNALPPSEFSPGEIDSNILGVIFGESV